MGKHTEITSETYNKTMEIDDITLDVLMIN